MKRVRTYKYIKAFCLNEDKKKNEKDSSWISLNITGLQTWKWCIWNESYELQKWNQMKVDPRSYERNYMLLRKEAWKKKKKNQDLHAFLLVCLTNIMHMTCVVY